MGMAPVRRIAGPDSVVCITVMFHAQRVFCNLMVSVQSGMLTAKVDLAMAFAVLCAFEDGHVVPSLESNLLATASAAGRIRLRRPMNP